jgi:hypothetical protein
MTADEETIGDQHCEGLMLLARGTSPDNGWAVFDSLPDGSNIHPPNDCDLWSGPGAPPEVGG